MVMKPEEKNEKIWSVLASSVTMTYMFFLHFELIAVEDVFSDQMYGKNEFRFNF